MTNLNEIYNFLKSSITNLEVVNYDENIKVGYLGIHLATIILNYDNSLSIYEFLGENDCQCIINYSTLKEMDLKNHMLELIDYCLESLMD